MIAVGLMSGTSLDGIDAALVRIVPRDAGYAIDLLNFVTVPFRRHLGSALARGAAAAHRDRADHRRPPSPPRLPRLRARRARASGALGVDYVASHGQTIYHDGTRALTMQLGDPFVIREALRATVCYDFRSADCVVGGNGAPLVPYVDVLLLADPIEDRVALNIGGIANVTALPRGASPNDVHGLRYRPGHDADRCLRADAHRASAAATTTMACSPQPVRVDEAALARDARPIRTLRKCRRNRPGASGSAPSFCLAHRACARAPFDRGRLLRRSPSSRAAVDRRRHRVAGHGGSARAVQRRRRMKSRTAAPDCGTACRMRASNPAKSIGVSGDAKEAMAFAVLGYETLRERAANVPRVTGASRAVPLGSNRAVCVAPIDCRRWSRSADLRRRWTRAEVRSIASIERDGDNARGVHGDARQRAHRRHRRRGRADRGDGSLARCTAKAFDALVVGAAGAGDAAIARALEVGAARVIFRTERSPCTTMPRSRCAPRFRTVTASC